MLLHTFSHSSFGSASAIQSEIYAMMMSLRIDEWIVSVSCLASRDSLSLMLDFFVVPLEIGNIYPLVFAYGYSIA